MARSESIPPPPLGVFPISPLITGTLCARMFPGFRIFSLAADSVFKIPMWRHFIVRCALPLLCALPMSLYRVFCFAPCLFQVCLRCQ